MNGRNSASNGGIDWKAGIVAIIGRLPSGRLGPIGTGFIASENGHICTCAHVVNQADWTYGQWDTPLQVRFNANQRFADALVLEPYLLPEPDVAILSLTGGLPAEVRTLPLVEAGGAVGHDTLMWGFPAGYESGLLGQGEVLGIEGRGQLQLTSTQTTHGYSGGPVWDTAWERVIGMISSGSKADSIGRLQYENFAVPAEKLVELAGGLLAITGLGDMPPVDLSEFDKRPLYREMKRVFNLEELQDLAYDLGVDFDELPGGTRSAKTREFIDYLVRRDMVSELLHALSEIEDKKVDWYAVTGARLL